MKHTVRLVLTSIIAILLLPAGAAAGNAVTWKVGANLGELDIFNPEPQRFRDKQSMRVWVTDDLGLEGATNVEDISVECRGSFTRFDEAGGPIAKTRTEADLTVMEFLIPNEHELMDPKGRTRVSRRLTESEEGRFGGLRYTSKNPVVFTHARDSDGTVRSLTELLTTPGVATKGLHIDVDYSQKVTPEVGDSYSARCAFLVRFAF